MPYPALPVWKRLDTREQCWSCWDACMDLLAHRNPALKGRSSRTEAAALHFATVLHVANEKLADLRIAARYHDIGLLSVPDRLLPSSAAQSVDDRRVRDAHTNLGGRLIAHAFPDFPDAVEAIWFHHERPDGRGPHALTETEIPLLAAIVGVCEWLDECCHPLDGSPPIDRDEILEQLHRECGSGILPSVADAVRFAHAAIAEILANPDSGEPVRSFPALARDQQGCDEKRHAPTQRVPEVVSKNHGSRTANGSGEMTPPRTPRDAARAVAELTPLLSEESLQVGIAQGCALCPQSAAIQSVLSVTASASCSADDVARTLMHDQSLSLQVLKLANSSAYSRGRPAHNLRDAVSRIGLTQLRQHIMATEIAEQCASSADGILDMGRYWDHSTACGLICSMLSQHGSPRNHDDPFLWGLLHDIGRLFLIRAFPEHYSTVLRITAELEVSTELVEKALLRIDHCEVVRRVFSRWQFSKELAASAIHHHDPISKLRRLPSDERPQAAITAMANELAHALALCDGANTMIGRLDPWVEYLGVPASLIEEISSRVPDEVETLKLALLSHTSDKVWSTASTDLRRQLALPLRPVTIALSPATCSFRLFANRLADHSSNDTEAGPNLAIVYIRGKSEEEKLFADLATLERRAGDGPLPTVIIHTTAPPNTEQAMLKQRPLRMLPAPTSQQRFLEAMGDLLRGREAQPAGALEAQV